MSVKIFPVQLVSKLAVKRVLLISIVNSISSWQCWYLHCVSGVGGIMDRQEKIDEHQVGTVVGEGELGLFCYIK